MESALNPRKILGRLFFIVLLDMIGLGIVIPFLPIIFHLQTFFPPDFPVTYQNIILGLLLTAYPLFQFLGSPILGRLSDRHGRRKILLLSLAGSFVGYLIFPMGIALSSVALLFLSRIVDGFTGGNISVAMAAIADITPEEKQRVKNYAFIGVAFGLGFILGPALGGILSDSSISPYFSIQTPFYAAAAFTLLNMFLVAQLPETLQQRSHRKINVFTPFTGIRKAWTIQLLRPVFASLFLANMGWVFFENYFQVFLFNQHHFEPRNISYFFAYLGVWIVFSQGFVVRRVSGHFRPLQLLRTTLITTAALLVLVVLVPKQWLYAVLPLLALSYGFTQPNFTTLLTGRVAEDSLGEVLGIRQSFVSLAHIIPPAIGGVLLNFHLRAPIITGAVVIALGWAVFLSIRDSKERISLH